MKRPLELYVLYLLYFIIIAGALPAGFGMVTESTGVTLGMSPQVLVNSPFSSFLAPGIILIVCIGLLPLYTLFGLIAKPHWQWAGVFNIYKGRHWAWAYSLYCGAIIVGWILIQITMIQYSILQPIIGGIGLLIIILTVLPRTMQYFDTQ